MKQYHRYKDFKADGCGSRSKKEKTAPPWHLSRYRECEEDSRCEQQVVNMCVNARACVFVCILKRNKEEGSKSTIYDITLFISQGAP